MDDKPSGVSSGTTKRSWWRFFWPVTENYEEAKQVARTYGGVVSAFLSWSWGVLAVVHFFFSDSPKDFAFYVTLAFYLLPTLFFVWLMRHIWNGQITIVPFILAWFVIQTTSNHITSPGNGWSMSILMTLFAIGALRGWWAVRKHDRANH